MDAENAATEARHFAATAAAAGESADSRGAECTGGLAATVPPATTTTTTTTATPPPPPREPVARSPWALTLALAVSYGGRSACAAAAQRLAFRVADGALQPADVDEKAFAAALLAADGDVAAAAGSSRRPLEANPRLRPASGGAAAEAQANAAHDDAAAVAAAVDLCVGFVDSKRGLFVSLPLRASCVCYFGTSPGAVS
jgi:hypothetical protein